MDNLYKLDIGQIGGPYGDGVVVGELEIGVLCAVL